MASQQRAVLVQPDAREDHRIPDLGQCDGDVVAGAHQQSGPTGSAGSATTRAF